MSLEYEEYKQEHEAGVIKLLTLCFPGKHITSKSLKWKYFDSSFNQKQRGMVALDGDLVCSFVSFVPLVVESNDKNILFYSCSVQATHPNYRRQGIVSDLTQLIENKLGKETNYLGFSNQCGVQIDLHSKKINYAILGQMYTRYFIPLSVWAKYTFAKLDNFSEIAKLKNTYDLFELAKSAEYLNWRFSKNPKCRYEGYKIFQDRKEIGVVVLKRTKIKYEILNIFTNDLLSIRKCFEATSHLALKKHVLFLSFSYLPNKAFKNTFPLSLSRRSQIYFTIKSRHKEFLNRERWLIQGGDIQ